MTARPRCTGVSFGWSNYAEYGNALGDQYVTLPPLKKDASTPDSQVKWDYSQDACRWAYSGSGLTVNPNAANQDAIYKVIDAMYGEKLSVAGFFGSIPDIVSDDGDHQYTIDKAKAYAEYPDTRAVALQDRFGGWIRDDVKMVNDTNADQVTASDLAVREARNRVDGVKDVVPIYVRPEHRGLQHPAEQQHRHLQLREQPDREVGPEGRHRQGMGCLREEGVRTDPRPRRQHQDLAEVVRQVHQVAK
ncbi:MAG: hypothetical protein V9G11_05755 [Bifidobacterium adolescentis]